MWRVAPNVATEVLAHSRAGLRGGVARGPGAAGRGDEGLAGVGGEHLPFRKQVSHSGSADAGLQALGSLDVMAFLMGFLMVFMGFRSVWSR